MNSRPRPIGSAPPPFYWKVPVPEKDYMSENYRRIRQIANQSQKKRSEPLKAAFIPGVTKNEKYAHVSSRVGEFLKSKKGSDVGQNVSAPTNQRSQQAQRPAHGTNQPINRRLSKSSTDLRQNTIANSHSAVSLKNSGPQHPQTATQIRRRRGSQESFHPAQESVYNWHFKDDVNPPGAKFSNGFHNSTIPAKYCHRVEYLPCDGICAEENFMVDDGPPESARSASSCRTSRGCNTEETRILEDPIKCFELDKHVDNCGDSGDSVQDACGELLSKSHIGPKPNTRSVHTMPSQTNFGRGQSAQWFNANTANSESNVLGFLKDRDKQKSEMGRIKTSASSTSLVNGGRQFQKMNGTGSEIPHSLGTVPKYLKQRQEEWKVQEKERRESEMNANVPQGYVLLSENERLEHLKTFKRNYDSLINDLNRIPIRIDTIRVREHKIQLEQQLTRLEEAMKTFSRPRVWIKVDD